MEHPLIGNLDALTADECQTKISELTKKLMIASRSGNGHLCQQLRMAMESYQSRMKSIYDDQMKKDGDNPSLHFDKIDIS